MLPTKSLLILGPMSPPVIPGSGLDGIQGHSSSRVYSPKTVSWGPLSAGRKTKASVPLPTNPGPTHKYLFRAVHAIPGFMLHKVLLPKVTLATFGTLEGFLPSVFPARKSHRGCGA